MKILILGPRSEENDLLLEAAKKRSHQVRRLSIKDLTLILKKNNFFVYYENKDLADIDLCLIRGVNPFFSKTKTVAKYFNRKNILVIDKELYKKVYAFDKMFMYSALEYHKVPCPNTYCFPSLKEFRKSSEKIDFPVILKDIQGMHGRNIFIKKTKKEMLEFFSRRKIRKFLIQEFFDVEYYYRILVVGNKVLGAMKRYTLKYIRSKRIPLKERSLSSKITKEQKEIALRAVKATNADIGGVDMIYDQKGHPFVLEVNRSPNFKRFTQVMKIDVADEIIQFLEKSYQENKK